MLTKIFEIPIRNRKLTEIKVPPRKTNRILRLNFSMEQFKIFAARGESEISNLCCPKGSDIYVSRESLFRFCKSHASHIRSVWTELVRLCNSTWKYIVDTSGIILKRVLPLSRTRFANDDEVSFLKSNVSPCRNRRANKNRGGPDPAWKTNMIHEKVYVSHRRPTKKR